MRHKQTKATYLPSTLLLLCLTGSEFVFLAGKYNEIPVITKFYNYNCFLAVRSKSKPQTHELLNLI